MKKLMCLVFALIVCLPVAAQAVAVNVELALLVDVSGSIDNAEFTLQRNGYVSAFNNLFVPSPLKPLPLAATLIYWSYHG